MEVICRLLQLVLSQLGWGDGQVVREGRLQLLPPDTNNWTRRGRANKMAPVHLMLVTHGQVGAPDTRTVRWVPLIYAQLDGCP